MFILIFLCMLRRTCNVYGDCLIGDLGLAPIALATPDELVNLDMPIEFNEETWIGDFDR